MMNSKPTALSVLADNIPDELKARPQWGGWRFYQKENGKWSKPPVDVQTGRFAMTNDPTTWASYSDALAAYEQGSFSLDGISYVFTADDSYSGTDLDGCIEGGELQPWAAEIIERLASYAEISPSGTGVNAPINIAPAL